MIRHSTSLARNPFYSIFSCFDLRYCGWNMHAHQPTRNPMTSVLSTTQSVDDLSSSSDALCNSPAFWYDRSRQGDLNYTQAVRKQQSTDSPTCCCTRDSYFYCLYIGISSYCLSSLCLFCSYPHMVLRMELRSRYKCCPIKQEAKL